MKAPLKRFVSIFLVAVLAMGIISPAFAAGGIVTHVVDIYADGAPVTERIVLEESHSLQLTAMLIDCSMPEGGYFVWESETPILASVDENGFLRAHDSSKGAVLRYWIDNEVRPIPIIGETLAKGIEALFDGMDVDAMDAEGILNVVENGATIIPETYRTRLVDSLREQLNKLDTGIKVTLFNAQNEVLATDEVRVLVTKSTSLTADFFPNGTTITNKSQVPKTVEVGYSIQLQGVTTPARVRMGVTWSVKEGKNFVDFTENGHATFKAPGKVVLMASPDAKGFMDNIVKWAELVGEQDPEQVASVVANLLTNTLGLPISNTVVKYVLWGLLYLAGTDNLVKWSEGAIVTVANYLLKLRTNDTVTVQVVQELPVQSFEIAGTTTVQEGSTQQLAIANIIPRGATSQGVVWTSANPEYIGVNRDTGLITGRDAGSAIGSRNTTITAVLDGISVSVGATVKGKVATTVTEIEITGPSVALIGVMTQMNARTFPARLVPVITWGLLADDGVTEVFATAGASAENSLARINRNGVLTPLEGGTVTVIAKTDETVKTYYRVFVGTLVTGLAIAEAPNVAIHVPLSQSYKNATAQLTPVFTPPDATNKKVFWSSDSEDVAVDENGVASPTRNRASFATITATSQDGGYKASVIVSFANYPVTGVSLDKTSLNLFEGTSDQLTESIEPKGFLTMGSASIKNVFWTSADTSIATVSDAGVVTAVSPGDTNITVTTIDGFKTAVCSVKVRANKAALNEIIDIVVQAELDPANHNPDDFEVFLQALEAALFVQSTELATQRECDEAAQYLAVTFNALNQYRPLQGITITFDGSPAPDYKTYKVGTVANYANQSMQFSFTIEPADADYKSVTWSSSNSSIGVDSTGKCQPTSNNPCCSVITVRAEDFIGNVYTDTVNVAFARVPATGIILEPTSISAALVHETYQLNATVEPVGTVGVGAASVPDVQWISSNPSAATVNDSGLVTCVGPGSAIIYAITRDGGHTASCSIIVSINKQLLKAALDMVNDANLDYLRYTPTTWNDLFVAQQHAQAVYDDPDAVQLQIDAATAQLNTAYSALKEYIYINSVSIWHGDNVAGDYVAEKVGLLGIYTNQTIELSLRMSPLDSYYESIVWSSSSSSISVNQDGVCKPTSNNACWSIITVKVITYYGRVVTDSVYVSFAKNNATRVDLTPSSITASIGNTPQKIDCKIKSEGTVSTPDADIQTVIWSSDNPEAVPVTQDGRVSFVDSGSATITATSVDGGVTGTCYVVVNGDKTALAAAIAYIDSLNINPQDYEYTTSTAFTNAYNHALDVYNGVSYSQQEIDDATAALYATHEALQPYVHMESLTILYEGNPAPSHISRKVELWQIYKNQSIQLGHSFTPSDAMYTSLVWASSDSSLEVDQTGKVKPTANKAGGALITLTATDHYGNQIIRGVFVAFANYPVTGMTIDKTSLTATVGDAPVTITASVTPTGVQGASVKKIYWTTSDASVAAVSQDGVVSYIDAGQCIITATTYDGGFTRTCPVTVYANKTALVNAINAITSLNLNPEQYTPDSWAVFAAAMEHAVEVQNIVFAKQSEVDSAKDDLLAAFDGLVMYVTIDAVRVTYSGAITNGYVTRDVPLTSTYQSQEIQLGYALFPADTTMGTIAWSSNSSSISVNENGLCKPTSNNACHAVITVTATDYKGNVRTNSINVAFANYPVTGVSVSPASIPDAIVGGSATLTATVSPTGTLGVGAANIKDVFWTSSDPEVASVNSNGQVSFLKAGTVSIIATSIDGGFEGVCTITISADKALLLVQLQAINNLNQTDYTPASWVAMMEIYNSAAAVYNDPLASQAQTDSATANLAAAYASLVNYVYVNSAAIAVNGVNQNGYVVVRVPKDSAYTSASVALGLITSPQNAMYSGVFWSSNNPAISVSQNGVAKPTSDAPCFATVTALITDHFGNTYTAKAVVAFVKVAAASITVTPTVINTGINSGTVQLTAVLTGEDGLTPDFPGIVWKSSNPAVASVNQNGLVTIGIGGMAIITASTQIGELSATCTVNVALDKSQLAAIINAVMMANYNPLDFTAASYTALADELANARAVYASPASDQETVDSATAALTAARDALVARVRINSIVITFNDSPAPSHISKKVELYQTYNSQSIQLGVTINPANAEHENLQWSSNSSSVVVDQNGLCKPAENKACTAVITVSTTDSFGQVFTDTVTVAFANYQVTGVSLDRTSLNFMYGDAPQTLTPSITPAGTIGGLGSASVKSVTWHSSNPDVATVDSNGTVTPRRPGSAVITCTTNDGGKQATCSVTVNGPQINAVAGSSVTVDRTRKYVYGVPEGTTDLSAYITNPYGSLAYTPNPQGLGTGSRIDVVYSGQVVDTYYLVIFGDANGDGKVNGEDAGFAAMAASYMLSLSDIQVFALDLNNNGKVDSSDAAKLEDAGLFIKQIDQLNPYA
ncbi:MAG: Ig-like domain-containing protein [Acutalibacteraceae bacterium]|jgi:uncharacterized protein YjdB